MNNEFFLSKCCLEPYKATITDEGEWKLKCDKCEKECGSLGEKFSINRELSKF